MSITKDKESYRTDEMGTASAKGSKTTLNLYTTCSTEIQSSWKPFLWRKKKRLKIKIKTSDKVFLFLIFVVVLGFWFFVLFCFGGVVSLFWYGLVSHWMYTLDVCFYEPQKSERINGNLPITFGQH